MGISEETRLIRANESTRYGSIQACSGSETLLSVHLGVLATPFRAKEPLLAYALAL
jgi:hypothetical protein